MPATTLSGSASAFAFAGGLAVGVGSVYALSRTSFAPATKVSKSTKDKLAKATRSRSTKDSPADTLHIVPLGEKLDAVDSKVSGPAAAGNDHKSHQAITAVLGDVANKAGHDIARLQPVLNTLARAKHVQTKMNLAKQLTTAESPSSSPPAWLTGLEHSTSALAATANGQIEQAIYRSSDAVFVYESATNAGRLGAWIEQQAADARHRKWPAGQGTGRPQVFSMQTRAGASAAILGYLRGSADGSGGSSGVGEASTFAPPEWQMPRTGNVVSALTDAAGLLAAAPALSLAPEHASDRIILHVSGSSQTPILSSADSDAGNLSVYDDSHAVLAAADALGHNANFAVVLSADRQEAVDVAVASYAAERGHVVHIFDAASAGRHVAAGLQPSPAVAALGAKQEGTSIVAALHRAGLGAFRYVGPDAPNTLLVVPNTQLAAAARAVHAALPTAQHAAIGVLAVRVVRPWSDAALREAVPASVRTIHVLEETHGAAGNGTLFQDVVGSIFANPQQRAERIQVRPIAKPVGARVTAEQWFALFSLLSDSGSGKAASSAAISWEQVKAAAATAIDAADLLAGEPGAPRLAAAFDTDASATSYTGRLVSRFFNDRGVRDGAIDCALLERFDNFTAGGVVRDDLLLSVNAPAPSLNVPAELIADQGAATLIVGDAANLLKAVDVFANVKRGGTVLIDSLGWTPAELNAKLRAADKRTLATKNARLYLVDTAAVVQQLQDAADKAAGGKAKAITIDREVAAAVLAVAFLRVHFNTSGSTLIGLIRKVLGTAPLGVAAGGLDALVNLTERSVQLFNFSNDDWAAAEPISDTEANAPLRPAHITFNNYARGLPADVLALEPQPAKGTWALSAWQALFPEAYGLEEQALRPDLHEKTWVVTITENRRLTPLNYDRNVFHMELSTEGTDLKYEVGEALGIHGWNDEKEVLEFIAWSSYNPDEVVSVPSATDASKYETRTVFQVLQQKLDIFGKPGKKFYEALSKLAANPDEARWLRFISSAEGSSTFKKLSEIETVTYADVLKMFPSARLSFEKLMLEVEEIKPRHYSIASAQAAVGNSVHLLIVTVDWKTPSGSPRYGQCTRYLANLHVGAKVTVSLKPSVMKLPPNDEQPIIMAGLGTGAAPFRAFIQARALQRAQGKKAGPLVYYFGSRYRSSEYLYGEELEAYTQDGVVSRLGLAFSRDQKHKIYIQDRMKEDGELLASYLAPELDALRKAGGEAQIIVDDLTRNVDPTHPSAGYFYLCGPTWPVPDATEAILNSFQARGLSKEQAEQRLEKLKEEERFVLEVY
ncbi:hypothetical protein K437DRAFT_276781 [Tilletiaria anomala UBC 951]|uniref:assimilatory sulfite reductase (NADPH) n=1 Tax=Tilletiaria anomala (strain ATCC 24038 / CBS 436.72 / UBC 951) TaxID=1037660 RepID=A0A066V4B5_TILAU|nr:uncharacterized protein K437DRAFT_276781 [Tilletiaria anomala UBC 951]KDN36562.1 hypothetical protein K437DRAFT_276781 [Tilletiaria anomala UBC 951]